MTAARPSIPADISNRLFTELRLVKRELTTLRTQPHAGPVEEAYAMETAHCLSGARSTLLWILTGDPQHQPSTRYEAAP